jgi:hypothetical protein
LTRDPGIDDTYAQQADLFRGLYRSRVSALIQDMEVTRQMIVYGPVEEVDVSEGRE